MKKTTKGRRIKHIESNTLEGAAIVSLGNVKLDTLFKDRMSGRRLAFLEFDKSHIQIQNVEEKDIDKFFKKIDAFESSVINEYELKFGPNHGRLTSVLLRYRKTSTPVKIK